MRKIEQQMVDAIRQREPLSGGNTTVTLEADIYTGEPAIASVYLHGKWIAEYEYDAQVTGFKIDKPHPMRPKHDVLMLVRRDDWVTATTQSRYNALLEAFAPNFKTRRKGDDWFIEEAGVKMAMPDHPIFVEGIWI